jgi:hypothetical protein
MLSRSGDLPLPRVLDDLTLFGNAALASLAELA